MSMMKKTLVMLLALITACGMLATGVFAQEMPEDAASSEGESAATEEAALPDEQAPATEEAASPDEQAPAAEVAAEAAETADPIEGSWVLNSVYEVKEGAEPVLLKKEENQSLYGAGIGIYTFEDGGYGHYNMIEAGDNLDEEASWTSAEPDVYTITESTGTTTMKYNLEEDTLHKSLRVGDKTLDFVYVRAFVGAWKLQQVLEIHEGDAPDELPKEENQSLYAEDESILTFTVDGQAFDEVKEGPNAYMTVGSWKMTTPDKYVYTYDSLEMEFFYFRVDDTLLRDVKDSAPDAAHPYLQFIYERVETEEAPAESEAENEGESSDSEGGSAAEAAPAEEVTPLTKTMFCTSQIGANVRSGGSTDDGVIGLIKYRGAVNVTGKVTKDGKDTGWLQIDYNGQTGYMHSANLSDTQPAVPQPAPQPAPADDPGELIADGQIFTGHTMYLYAPEGGGVLFEAHELTDGRWADPDTGVTYEQEGGGGYHFYGSDGSVWVTEAYFAEYPVGSNGLDDDGLGEDELIADGQIFTGATMYLYAPDGNGMFEAYLLTDGRWANPNTGVTYEQEGGGGYHFYGSDGSVWVTEAYFLEYPIG